MRINVVYPKDGWILQHMGDMLIKYYPERENISGHWYGKSSVKNLWKEDSPIMKKEKGVINYFINYAIYRKSTPNKDVLFFTHPIDERFWKLSKTANLSIFMTKQYCDKAISLGSNAVNITPGIDDIYRPKLVLGFVGSIKYGERKGKSLLDKVDSLKFVNLKCTNKTLKTNELPDFYSSLDYILVTSTVEGGPMCILEGLGCGKQIICPHTIGFASEYKSEIINYNVNSFESLEKILRKLYSVKKKRYDLVKDRTWERWSLDHYNAFKNNTR